MKRKTFAKRLLSLVMALLMVFPAIGLASNDGVVIKAVYFQDENGNMVFVDYAEAIRQSIGEGNHTLYNAIREYVGAAEAKGRPVYVKLFSGKVLDYSLAMLDNLFLLSQIIGKEKYEVDREIKCTYELKVIDGEAVIVEIKEEKDSEYAIEISGAKTLELGETGYYDIRVYGDGKGNINYRARYEYTITGGTGKLEYLDDGTWREIPLTGYFGPKNGFTLTPDWDVTTRIRLTPNEEGIYSVELLLKDLDKDRILAEVEYVVTVNKPTEEPVKIVDITPVQGVRVEVGTAEEVVKEMLPKTTTILDSKDNTHTVDLSWTIEGYNKDIVGDYTAIGTFELPEGVTNPYGLELKVYATVIVFEPVVEPEWPVEVESVFVGKSAITGNTYANIKIKAEYVPFVEAVYVYGELANKMEDDPSQWRIQVEDNTEVEDLKGNISVVVSAVMIVYIEPVDDISVEFGTSKADAIAQLSPTTIIKDNRGGYHTVDLEWEIEGYNGNVPGNYNAVATFELPDGVEENPNIELKVRATVTVMEKVILVEFFKDQLLGDGFGLGKLIAYKEIAKGYENASKYAVVYTVGDSDVTVTTDIANFGEAPNDLVQYIKGVNRIHIILYDADGSEIARIENVME